MYGCGGEGGGRGRRGLGGMGGPGEGGGGTGPRGRGKRAMTSEASHSQRGGMASGALELEIRRWGSGDGAPEVGLQSGPIVHLECLFVHLGSHNVQEGMESLQDT